MDSIDNSGERLGVETHCGQVQNAKRLHDGFVYDLDRRTRAFLKVVSKVVGDVGHEIILKKGQRHYVSAMSMKMRITTPRPCLFVHSSGLPLNCLNENRATLNRCVSLVTTW